MPTPERLGEALYGAGRGYRPLFYLTLSTGIGGGLVSSDTVYRGADSYAGEIGHLTVRPEVPNACADHRVAWSGCAADCGWNAIMGVPPASCCAILHL